MEAPIINKEKNKTLNFGSFKRTNNTPLDYNFLISSLSNINDEIPIEIRHNGMMFFSVEENKLYHFLNPENGSDITSYTCLNEQTINRIEVDEKNYNDILDDLDSMFASITDKRGLSCYIKPLNIMVTNDGTNWGYMCGDYKISNSSVWSTIPLQLKSIGKSVIVGDEHYNVGTDYQLEKKTVVASKLPEILREGVYYEVGNNLYRVTNGYPYKVATKSSKGGEDPDVGGVKFQTISDINISSEYINPLSTSKNNIINHNIDGIYLDVKISYTNSYDDYQTTICPVFEVIDRNNISIKSMMNISQAIITITKIYEDE